MESSNQVFGVALEAMRLGARAKRPSWEGYLLMQKPDEHSKMNQPYIYATCKNGEVVPAVINQLDMLASDWIILEN